MYDWEDEGSFAQWLKNHPNFYSNVSVSINFIKKCTLVLEGTRGTDLVTFLDDVHYEHVFELSMDGTKADNKELLMDEKELVPSLKFKQTSAGVIAGN